MLPIERLDCRDDVIEFDSLENSLSKVSAPEVFLPWKQENSAVVFQNGKDFERRLERYNEQVISGAGKKKLLKQKRASSSNSGPASWVSFISGVFGISFESQEERRTAHEFEQDDFMENGKYRPSRNMSQCDLDEVLKPTLILCLVF